LLVVWAASPPGVIQERLLRRHTAPDEDDLSDADWLVYLDLRRKAEPIRRPHVVVNTATDFDTLLAHLLSRIQSEADAAS
jgi:predicted kinase